MENFKSNFDLSSIDSLDLILELGNRGHYTDLVISSYDILRILDCSINEGRDKDKIIQLSEADIKEILRNCFANNWHIKRLYEDIEIHILDNYDDSDYYQTKNQ